MVVGVDPGRHIGLAWVDAHGRLLRSGLVELSELPDLRRPPAAVIALGDGTGSAAARAALEGAGHPVRLVDERHSSEEGRRLYFRDHPPRGLARLLPPGLRSPGRLVDDYAAYAIALRWLASGRPTHEEAPTD